MYIEDKKVVSNDKGLVTFEDGTVLKYSEEWAEFLITPEPEDYIDHTFRKYTKVVQPLLTAFKDGNFITKDIEDTMKCIQESVRQANQNAICEAFGSQQHDQIPFSIIFEKDEQFRNKKKSI